MADLLSLNGKTALVTGASAGLGAHFAETLARAGAIVIVAARREAALHAVEARISASGGKCRVLALDVSSTDSIAEAAPHFDDVDILVNNAGIVAEKPLLDQTEEDWDRVVDTNLKGIFFLTQTAARAMKAHGRGGSIINIGSVMALRQGAHVSSYAAAKAAVVQLTKVSALELARFGIRVNCICPGYFATDMNSGFWDTDAGKAMLKRIPQRRLGQPNELAGPLLLLASDASSYMTGSIIVADGGHLTSTL